MKNILTYTLTFALAGSLFAQEEVLENRIFDGEMSETTKEGWTIKGANSLLFNQAAFSNWVSGGDSSIGLLGNVDYEFNYRKDKHMWDNRIILGYGLQSTEGEESKKTSDVINLTSKYRRQINDSKWYIGSALNFKTQFTNGYEYDDETVTIEGVEYTTQVESLVSSFMAPGYLQIGAGIDYLPNKNFEFNFHPLTSKMTFVNDDEVKVDSNGETRYGLDDADDSFVYELGLFVGVRHKINLMKNVTFDHQIGMYSNYLDNPDHIDISYSAILNMQINKYISTQLTGDLLYDHDIVNSEGERRLQSKQTLGIGVTYSFNK